MERVCIIDYPNGHMRLRLDEFFPCKDSKLRKLVKTVISISYDRDRDKVCCTIKDYLKEKIVQSSNVAVLKELANKYSNCETSYKEYSEKVQKYQDDLNKHKYVMDGYKRNSPQYKLLHTNYKRKKEELSRMKEVWRSYRDNARHYKRMFNDMMSAQKKYKRNLELFTELTE